MLLRVALSLCCLLACLGGTGCASATDRMQLSAMADRGAPDDFALDVTILTDKAWPPDPQAHMRSGRFILFSDGSLHYGVDPIRGSNWVPGITRTLSRAQVVELWELASQLDATDAGSPRAPENLKGVKPASGQMVYLVVCNAWEDRWQFVERFEAGREPASDAPMTALIRRLAALAWVTDLPTPEPFIIPKRYDFGPDPYERFRTTAASPGMLYGAAK
jgi:hypothetical protein